jgi:hypothetical protein
MTAAIRVFVALSIVGGCSASTPVPQESDETGHMAPFVSVVTAYPSEKGERGFLLSFTNPTDEPVTYSGYAADSFDPDLPDGWIHPTYRRELDGPFGWTARPMDFCGYGLEEQELEPGEAKVFRIYVQSAELPARIGVTYRTEAGAERTAWSERLTTDE